MRVVVFYLASLLVGGIPIHAQRSDVARVAVAQPARLQSSTYAVPVVADSEWGKLHWPYVVGGALAGGAIAGVVVAHSVNATDDQPIGDVGLIGLVVLGGLVAGAVAGWLVGELR